MIAITTALIRELLGNIFVQWLSCEAITTVVSLFIIAYVFGLFSRLVNR